MQTSHDLASILEQALTRLEELGEDTGNLRREFGIAVADAANDGLYRGAAQYLPRQMREYCADNE